jgi:hypothetical protein
MNGENILAAIGASFGGRGNARDVLGEPHPRLR